MKKETEFQKACEAFMQAMDALVNDDAKEEFTKDEMIAMCQVVGVVQAAVDDEAFLEMLNINAQLIYGPTTCADQAAQEDRYAEATSVKVGEGVVKVEGARVQQITTSPLKGS